MTVYYILLILIGVLSILTINVKKQKIKNTIVIGLCSIYIIIIQALRDKRVGTDIIGYLQGYKSSSFINVFKGEKLYNYESGYTLLNKILNGMNVSEQIFLLIIAIIIMIPIAITWIRYSKMPGLSVLLYMAFGFLTMTFSGLRQSIAIGITFYSYSFIKEKKLIHFIIAILLAMQFHTSSVIFLIAYPIYYLNIGKEKIIFLIPIFVLGYVFRKEIFIFASYVYEGKALDIEYTNAYGLLIFMIIILILSYIFYKKENQNVNAYRNYILVAIFFQMLASYSNIVGRTGYYYWIFITLLIPEILINQKVLRTRLIGKVCIVMFLVIYYIMRLKTGYLDIVPYKFYWT